ncbi:MAG: hypothetical protein ACF8Q5_00505 [Phycisphaerales bacterium JB040]
MTIRNASARSLAVASLPLIAGIAAADVTDLFGDGADYEIRQDTNTLARTTADGAATVLDVIADASFDAQERRAIFQFDLSSLGTNYASINSATLYITLQSVDVFPSTPADLWGSSQNRTGAIFEGDAGATDEFDAPSYALVAPNFAPIANPTLTNVVYSMDLTAFIGARYADYAGTPAESWVMLRAQPSSLVGTDFYNFYSGDAAQQFRPRLEIDFTIPTPASAVLLGLGGVIATRRKR